MKIVVVLPTYNEKDTIKSVLDGILAHKNVHVLVVDDNSPDGTAGIVKKYKSKRVHLLSGEKQGLGAAYRRGMSHAITRLGATIVLEMDADLSHNPADIPRLVKALDSADVVIGSRYIRGGKITGWGAGRKLLSWGGNVVARAVAGLWPIRDCTAGFRAIRVEALAGIDWDTFPAKGYGFQIALLHHARSTGKRIVEVPVTFVDREHGTSKLGVADISEFLLIACKLGMQSHGQLFRFLLVGLSGLFVNLAVFSSLYRLLGVPVWPSWALGLETSLLWNFVWHDVFTFRKDTTNGPLTRLWKYHATAFVGILVNFAVFSLLFVGIGVFAEASNVVAIASATIWNYLVSSRWAWR